MIKKILFFNFKNFNNIKYYSQNTGQFFKKFFHFGKEVQNALNNGIPIVALESALITSGLEYPINLKVAQNLEEIIRSKGSVPATIAILDGKIRVGIDLNELEKIAEPNNNNKQKCSLRDLANCLIQNKIGGTTVAATMWIAHQAGIKIFSTGGIGGVHKGGEQSLDISADLVELGRCPVAVVCAGVKSILDIGRTLEFLETQGVNVLVLGKNSNFPGFFTPQTEFQAPHCTESLKEIADIIACSQQLDLQKGILIACPIPIENKIKLELIEKSINQALNEAKNNNIYGKKVTPFVLKRVAELSEGESVKLNISLLENNARIASQLAILSNTILKKETNDFNLFTKQIFYQTECSTSSELDQDIKKFNNKKPKIVCIGASVVDIEVLSKEENNKGENISSYLPSEIVQRAGGVARNHAEALARLGNDVILISAFGKQLNGQPDIGASFLLNKMEKLNNLDCSLSLFCNNLNTATSVSIGSSKGILQGFISVDQLLNQINCEFIDKISSNLFNSTDFILIDANLSSKTIKRINYLACKSNTKIWLEPTNSLKIPKLFDALGDYPLINVDIFSPNLSELKTFSECVSQKIEKNLAKECNNFITQIEEKLFSSYLSINNSSSSSFRQWLSKIKLPQILQPKKYLIITCDCFGVLLFSRLNRNEFSVKFLEAPKICLKEIRSVSGAGDCFNCGFLTAILNNFNLMTSLEFSKKCAELSLLSTDTVPDTINEELINNLIIN